MMDDSRQTNRRTDGRTGPTFFSFLFGNLIIIPFPLDSWQVGNVKATILYSYCERTSHVTHFLEAKPSRSQTVSVYSHYSQVRPTSVGCIIIIETHWSLDLAARTSALRLPYSLISGFHSSISPVSTWQSIIGSILPLSVLFLLPSTHQRPNISEKTFHLFITIVDFTKFQTNSNYC